MYAEGTGKEAALQELKANGPGDGHRVQGYFAGAKLMSYASDRARVDIAMVFDHLDGAMGAMTIDLRWEKGDWRVVTADDGTMVIPPVTIHSLDGYILTPAGTER